MDEGWASEHSQMAEVLTFSCYQLEGDTIGPRGPTTVPNVDHGHEGLSPKPVGETCVEEESLGAVGKGPLMSFDTP